MTNTINPSRNDTWQYPTSYEQPPAPAAELPVGAFELDADYVDPLDAELEQALYIARLSSSDSAPEVTDARADVQHAINTAPEAVRVVDPAENVRFVGACVEHAKAYSQRVGLMQDNLVKQSELELAA